MGKVFYLTEILQFAIEKEQQSYDLYATLADKVTDSAAKDLFHHLMGQEQHHKEYYADMLSKIEQKHMSGVHEDEEYMAYMQELIAESRKIAPITQLDFNDLGMVFDYAIGREKDSILFYEGLKGFVSESIQRQIDQIIREEGKHIVKICALREGKL